MPVSKAHQAASAKYNAAHYDTIRTYVRKGGSAALKAHAAKHDRSLSAFLLRCIRQTLIDDGAAPDTIDAICGGTSDSSGD